MEMQLNLLEVPEAERCKSLAPPAKNLLSIFFFFKKKIDLHAGFLMYL